MHVSPTHKILYIYMYNYDRHMYNLTSDSMREVAAAPKWSEKCATSSPAEIMHYLTISLAVHVFFLEIILMWKCTNPILEGGGFVEAVVVAVVVVAIVVGGGGSVVEVVDVRLHDAMSRKWDKIYDLRIMIKPYFAY